MYAIRSYYADSAREHAPLLQAADAVPIDSTRLSIDEVLAEMLRIVQARRQASCSAGSPGQEVS